VLKKKGQDMTALKPFDVLRAITPQFLKEKNLSSKPITVAEALSDLLTVGEKLEACNESPRFKQGAYGKQKSAYQRLMHGEMNGALADSHRIARHRPETISKFSWLLENCTKGKKLDQDERGEYANKKHTIYILKPDEPSPTLTTLPDDILHYKEPRILTVREIARLQSFPDWFAFKGKYTTGGKERVQECPRYTQVGNAVPPLLAEALGETLKAILKALNRPA
jgi:DNA (cytosine-5)-methyltransferase 1